MAKQITRRELLVAGAATGAGLVMAEWLLRTRLAYAFYQSPTGVQKFAQALRGVGDIPVATSDGLAPVTGATHYSLNIENFTDQLLPDTALGMTTLWGYNPAGNATPRHLGGIIVAQRDAPIQLTVTNKLPAKHILPVDTSVNFPDAHLQNATTTHLHGGFVSWISDGGPATWFTPPPPNGQGQYGPSTSMPGAPSNIYKLLNPGLQPGQAEYYYPNTQSARMLWYHDHAHDLTRLNAYAGIASAYILRDTFEGAMRAKGLPEFMENGGREIPIVIQDKIFVGQNILAVDPTWTGPTAPGSLWYPHTYERKRWTLQGNAPAPYAGIVPPGVGNKPQLAALPDPSVIPEMFGDTMLANGTVYPRTTVEARRYRLRILNACNARFLNLQLYVDDGSTDGITLNPNTLAPTNATGPDFLVIGAEGGFLPDAVTVPSNVPFNPATLGGSLITAPAERYDVLVDFSEFANKKIILYNDAPAPFPLGAPINDYFPGAPKNPTVTQPGFGPNTRQIMRFDVVAATGTDASLAITSGDLSAGLNGFLVPPGVTVLGGAVQLPPGVPVRQLTLNETFDSYGRLIQLLGTNAPLTKTTQTFGRAYLDPATETVNNGVTEVWQIANLTGDTHPIHFHLVNVQVMARQPFKMNPYNGTPSYTGPAVLPDLTERGWKETVRMNPGEVTTVVMKFELPPAPPNVVMPLSARTGGHEYVWHCHILEHEEHDMMRPLIVTP